MKKLIQIAGVRLLAYIEANIKSGHDYNGQPFQYSKKPFWRPYDPAVIKKLEGKNGAGRLYNTVTGKNGKLGMIILGGYDQYKKKLFPQSYGSFLTATGKMLRSISILKTDKNTAVIGFADPENAEKAFFLNVSGAGKSRKLWKFMGITQNQSADLTSILSDEFRTITIADLTKIIARHKDTNG